MKCPKCDSINIKFMSSYYDEVAYDWKCRDCETYFDKEDNKK